MWSFTNERDLVSSAHVMQVRAVVEHHQPGLKHVSTTPDIATLDLVSNISKVIGYLHLSDRRLVRKLLTWHDPGRQVHRIRTAVEFS